MIIPYERLWGIHLLAALITAIILKSNKNLTIGSIPVIPQPADIIGSNIRAMTSVCAWVILFRIILSYVQKYLLCIFPQNIQILFSGFTELTVGTLMLKEMQTQGSIYIAAGCMLSFGGLCVLLQTYSVTKQTGLGLYFPGKVLQTCITFLLLYPVHTFIFTPSEQCHIHPATIIIPLAIIAVFIIKRKKL